MAVGVAGFFEPFFRATFDLRHATIFGILLGVSAAFRHQVQANKRKRPLGFCHHCIVLHPRRNSNPIRLLPYPPTHTPHHPSRSRPSPTFPPRPATPRHPPH